MKEIFCLLLIVFSGLANASSDYDCPNLSGKYKSAQILNPKNYLEMVGIEISQKVVAGITEYTVTEIYQGVDENRKYTDIYKADAVDHVRGDNPIVHSGVYCFQNMLRIYQSFYNGLNVYDETQIGLIEGDKITYNVRGRSPLVFSRIQ